MTVDKQPRALYLADVLAAGFECDQEWYEIESAKELRRLHAENEDFRATCDHLIRENAEHIGEIERLRAMLAAASQPKLYPLPDDLYGGSKDWRAGSYAERVEWLHLMYEGAKEEIERLGQTQGEQEPAPNGATHRQPKQGAFYKRVDGKWYVWSRMENGEPHRWYISPGTSESCLEPINAAASQPPRQPLTDEEIADIEDMFSNEFGLEAKHAVDFARAIERAHGIGGKV